MSRPVTDSVLYRGLSRLTELIIVNLVTVVGCLPVVTAGAALTACYACCLNMAEGSDDRLLRRWWAVFRGSLLPATAAWLLMLVTVGLLWWEWGVAGDLVSPLASGAAHVAQLVVAMCVLLVGLWLWPMLACAVMPGSRVGPGSFARLLGAALLAGIGHLPRSLAGLCIWLLPPLAAAAGPAMALRLLMVYAVVGVSCCSHLTALLLAAPLAGRARD